MPISAGGAANNAELESHRACRIATTPDPGGSYGDPKRLTIVLALAPLNADNIAFLGVSVADGNDISEEILIAGPKARSIQFMPIGGTGGGPTCAAY